MKHLIVIPTYNEAGNINNIILEIFALNQDSSILVVDDSSPDGTRKIVEQLQEKYRNLYLLNQNKKMGLANAYRNGFLWGIKHGFDVFTSFDADFSHNPIYLKNSIELIKNGYDVVCASRYISKGNTQEKSLYRNFISKAGNTLINLILGNEFNDWTGGFNTYTKNSLEKIDLYSITAQGYIFQTEMKYKAVRKSCSVIEFPIEFFPRKTGKSKMSFKIVIEAFFHIFYLKFKA